MRSIDINKKYRTVTGLDVELITTSGRGVHPVLGYIGKSDTLSEWHSYGSSKSIGNRLVEVKPPEDRMSKWAEGDIIELVLKGGDKMVRYHKGLLKHSTQVGCYSAEFKWDPAHFISVTNITKDEVVYL